MHEDEGVRHRKQLRLSNPWTLARTFLGGDAAAGRLDHWGELDQVDQILGSSD